MQVLSEAEDRSTVPAVGVVGLKMLISWWLEIGVRVVTVRWLALEVRV